MTIDSSANAIGSLDDERRVEDLRAKLTAALRAAQKARDSIGVSAMRTALGALDNATAVEQTSEHVETYGGSSDVPRRVVTFAECQELLAREVLERLAAADQAEAHGRAADAERIRAEAERTRAFLER